MHAFSRPARSMALATGTGWLALLMLTGAAGAAQPIGTQVAAGSQVAQLEQGSASTVVQEARPSPVDTVSHALEERLHKMAPVAHPTVEH